MSRRGVRETECDQFLAIFGGKSQSSLPLREERSTSTSATPALDNLSDAPVSAEIVLVKSGSWPTIIKLSAEFFLINSSSSAGPNPGASRRSSRHFISR